MTSRYSIPSTTSSAGFSPAVATAVATAMGACITWRKIILLHRSALLRAWCKVFPKHDFGTGRLMRYTLDTFERACDRAEAEAAKRNSDPKIERLRRLLEDDVSFDTAYREITDPRTRPTPQCVIEAILHCVRERGPAALKERANVERLRRCDTAALEQIDRRIAKLKGIAA
jgi:hypothetical protein